MGKISLVAGLQIWIYQKRFSRRIIWFSVAEKSIFNNRSFSRDLIFTVLFNFKNCIKIHLKFSEKFLQDFILCHFSAFPIHRFFCSFNRLFGSCYFPADYFISVSDRAGKVIFIFVGGGFQHFYSRDFSFSDASCLLFFHYYE